MATLYILAIGGSGARVVKSLAMLLPALPSFGRFDTVKPILIDSDENNKSLDRTKRILEYYEVSKKILKPDFFNINIEKHDGKYIEPVPVKDDNDSKTFGHYVDFLGIKNKDTAKLVELLFSGKSSAGISLLTLDMDEGFQGNPNIGSIVMSTFAEKFLDKMRELQLQTNDEILFITSIFGGMGAAGFPAFWSKIRDDKTEAGKVLKSVNVGAISLLPYYGLPKKQNEAHLNGLHFVPKAKSALNYYLGNTYTGLEYFCYIAHEFDGAAQPENERGGNIGGGQDNPAFFAELMAALAVWDYANETLNDGKTVFKQIASINNNNKPIKVDNGSLNDKVEAQIKVPFEKLSEIRQTLNEILELDENIRSQIEFTLIELSKIRQGLSIILNKNFLEKAISAGGSGYAWTKRERLDINRGLKEKKEDNLKKYEDLNKFFKEFDFWKANLKETGQGFIVPDATDKPIILKKDETIDLNTSLDRWTKKNSKGSKKGINGLLEYLIDINEENNYAKS